jgi:hypothetical protein
LRWISHPALQSGLVTAGLVLYYETSVSLRGATISRFVCGSAAPWDMTRVLSG